MSQPIPLSPPAQPTTRAQRAAARSRRRRRSLVVSGISTVVVIGGLATFILTSPGWPAVKQTFFSVSAFTSSFSSVLSGFWLDVKMFLIVEVIVLILGLLIALVRTVRVPALFPVRMLAIVYVHVMGGVRGRERVRPPQPARRRPRPRSDAVAGAAVRHRSPGGPPGGAAAAQRLH